MKAKTEKSATRKYRAEEYTYSVRWSAEDETFVGEVAEMKLLIGCGASPAEALREIMKIVADSIDILTREGKEIPEPFSRRKFSGVFNVRTSPSKHKELVMEAARQGVSLNQLVNLKLNT